MSRRGPYYTLQNNQFKDLERECRRKAIKQGLILLAGAAIVGTIIYGLTRDADYGSDSLRNPPKSESPQRYNPRDRWDENWDKSKNKGYKLYNYRNFMGFDDSIPRRIKRRLSKKNTSRN